MTDEKTSSDIIAVTPTKEVGEKWPNRYYASYDMDASGPTQVSGWYDVWNMSNTANVPDASSMMALTDEQWEARLPYGQGIHDGSIVPYFPVESNSLAEQAGYAYSAAVSEVQSEYGVLNEPTPDDWVAYLKALKAIRDGTDTTSTSLPESPS